MTPSKSSDTTKEARKAQEQADKKAGNLKPAGEAGDLKGTQPTKGSTTDKAARKAETKEAVKTGKTTPAGEGPDAPKK